MPDSKYPGELDTDKELPRVDDNITEIGGDAINGLRSAVFQIEETLGLDPQGTAADVAARLDQSLAPDGSIKASALTTIGLVALPITNSMIAATAGIEESKLDLDYSTVQLKTWIDENRVRIISLENKVAVDINNLTQHVAHPSTYGRHYTSDIDGYVAPYASQNLQGIVTDIRGRIDDHIADPTDAHDASAISVDNSNFLFINATDGQTAFEELDELGVRALVQHQDRQHSNGILRTQETFLPGTNRNVGIVASAAATVVEGVNRVTFSAAQANLAIAARGDVIDVTLGSNTYKLRIDEVISNTLVNTINPSPASGTGTAAVYRTSEETSEPANLIVATKKADFSGEVLQLVQPAAPFLVSSGLDVRALTAGVQNIRVGWASGNTGDIDVLAAMTAFSANPSNWTPENLTQVLNDTFTTAGSPLIAFHYKGEMGLAFDEPEGTLTALAPSGGSTAWEALGFNEGEIAQSLEERKFYIDGYEIAAVRKIVSTTGAIVNGSDTIVAAVNLDDLGIKENGIVRVKNSTADDGTWIFDQVLSTNLNVLHNFSTNENVTIDIYADYFGITTPTDRTLYELFVDGYQFVTSQLRGTRRLTYQNAAGTPNNPESWFDIVAVSRTFRTNPNKRIQYESRVVTLGDRSGATIINPGVSVSIPSSDSEGFRFKLYDVNGIDYVEIEVAADPGTNNINYIDLEIFDRISEELYVQVGTVLHNTTSFKHLEDLRLFGNVGRQDVRDDFTRDNITYPRSLLRGAGIIRGFGVAGTTTVSVAGGEILVNGTVFSIGGKNIAIPENGAAVTYNVFVDADGAFQMLEDGFYASGVLTTPTLAEILSSDDKTIIAQVDINAGNTVDAIRDLRRFVNKLDNKIDLIVEENDITHGSFASLQAAVNYINAYADLPVPMRIRVRGTIDLEITASADTIILPAGTTLEGDSLIDSIIYVTNSTPFSTIIPGNGCTIRDLGFQTGSTTLTGAFIGGLGSDITGIRIERCRFVFDNPNASNFAIAADDVNVIKISNCLFTNPGRAIYCDNSVANSVVKNSAFTGVVDIAVVLNNVTNMEISGNIFDAPTVVSITSVTNLTINDNTMTGISDNAIVLTTDPTDVLIHNNYILKSSAPGAATRLIRVEDGTRITIDKNHIECTDTSGADGRMISAEVNAGNQDDGFTITNNTLVNPGGSDQGIGTGIQVDDGPTNFLISGNLITGFYGNAASHGMFFSQGLNESIISNNFVRDGRFCLSISGGINDVLIADNFFEGAENINVVRLDHISLGSGSNVIFTGNYVTGEGNTGQDIVYITASGPGGAWGYLISDNVFRHNAGATIGAILEVTDTSNHIICNNWFRGAAAFSGDGVINGVGAADCLVAHNYFFVSATTMINLTGTGNTDINNKGQTYSVVFPTHSAVVDMDVNGGACSWLVFGGGWIATKTIYDSTFNLLAFSFGTETVPVGATINNVEIWYNLVGVVGDFQLGWSMSRGFGPSVAYYTLRAAQNAQGTGNQYETILPAGPAGTNIMQYEDHHGISLEPQNTAGPYTISVLQGRVNYTL